MNLTVIGIGRLGLCSALIFEKSGYNVLGVDISQDYVNKLNQKNFKTKEPLLNEYLVNSKNFTATTSLNDGLEHSNYIFILVDTPNGGGDNFYDHSKLSNLLVNINKYKPVDKNIVICSTVMPNYINNIAKMLLEDCKNVTINYNPEFIAQGNIIYGLCNPDMVLIGTESNDVGNKLKDIYTKTTNNTPHFSIVGCLEAEIIKISVNGFITTKLSYANMISDVCDNCGANKDIVLNSIGKDSRIGNKYFNPGYSFGGPCFPRDTKALSKFINSYNIKPIISDASAEYNDYHIKFQAEQLLKQNNSETYLFRDVAFKEDTIVPIIEESAKLKIAKYLVNKGKHVIIKDNIDTILEVKKEYGNIFDYKSY